MVEIKAAILDELEEIDVHFAEGDDTEDAALSFGYMVPILQVSDTVFNPSDILAYHLVIGRQSVPYLKLSISDTKNEFRTSDCIDESTEIRTWLGSVRVDDLPINLDMEVIDVKGQSNDIYITARLKMPTDKLCICQGTFKDMLSDLCDKSKLGLRLNAPDFEDVEVKRNFYNVTAEEFLNQICKMLGFSWYIDGQYNICIHQLQAMIDDHEDEECSVYFENYEDFDKAVKVIYSNSSKADSHFFHFNNFNYNYINVDNSKPELQNAEFDKSFDVDLEKTVVDEEQPIEKPDIYDVAQLYIKTPFDPYLMADRTKNIELYTQEGDVHRVSYDEYSQGQEPTDEELLIEDMSGVYLLADVEYAYPGDTGRVEAWCSFVRPPQEES